MTRQLQIQIVLGILIKSDTGNTITVLKIAEETQMVVDRSSVISTTIDSSANCDSTTSIEMLLAEHWRSVSVGRRNSYSVKMFLLVV